MIEKLFLNWKKIVIAIVVIFIFLLGLKLMFRQSTTEKLEDYMNKQGFVLDGEGYLWNKQISDLNLEQYLEKEKNGVDATYEVISFNVKTYKLIKNEMVSSSTGFYYSFTPVYDYKTQKLTYDYRIVVGNSNAIFEGEYNIENKDFICKNIYSYEFDIEGNESDFCDKIKYDVEDFYYESLTLVKSGLLVKEMKEN